MSTREPFSTRRRPIELRSVQFALLCFALVQARLSGSSLGQPIGSVERWNSHAEFVGLFDSRAVSAFPAQSVGKLVGVVARPV